MELKQIIMLAVLLISGVIGSAFLITTLNRLDHEEEKGNPDEGHDHGH